MSESDYFLSIDYGWLVFGHFPQVNPHTQANHIISNFTTIKLASYPFHPRIEDHHNSAPLNLFNLSGTQILPGYIEHE